MDPKLHRPSTVDERSRPTSRWAKTAAGLAAGLALIVGVSTPAYAGVGELDTSFSGDGTAFTDFTSDPDSISPGYFDYASDVAVLPDGKILAVGKTGIFLALARYNPDGSADPTFGGGDGMVLTRVGHYDLGKSTMAILADGRILAAATFSYGTDYSSNASDLALLRFHADGTLDTSHGGGDGIATVNVGHRDSTEDLAVQSDGKVVVVGTSKQSAQDTQGRGVLVRFEADGSLDMTFGGGTVPGTTTIGSVEFRGVALASTPGNRANQKASRSGNSTERIVVVGSTIGADADGDFLVARYEADGWLDNSFGGIGIVRTDVDPGDHWNDVAVQGDGRLVMTGGSDRDIAVGRYTTQGSLDPSFGGDGIVVSGPSDGFDTYGNELTLLKNGKILAVGGSQGAYPAGSDVLLAQYNQNGSLDPTFGNSGALTTDYAKGSDYAAAVAVQSDGKVVVAGRTADYDGTNSTGPSHFIVARYRMAPSGLSA